MFDLAAVQNALRQFGIAGWLLYDFRGLNLLARRVLQFPSDAHASRRWFYLIPAEGEPRKLLHRIEPHSLDHVPGASQLYLRWQELEAGVAELLAPLGQGATIAMEYVPRNANPYVSRVDAGTIELVKSCGVHIVSSGDLVQLFEACWDDEQWQMHLEAAQYTSNAFTEAFQFLADRVRRDGSVRETEVQQFILDYFVHHRLVTDHAPICAVGPHSGDPHYAPQKGTDALIQRGDFVLIDLWAKLDKPRAVYSDLTWTAYVGSEVPEKYTEIFRIVAQARDAAIDTVRQAFADGTPLQGWQVDQAARAVIEQAGYGPYFCHRTGHSIGQETHGNGANMDNLETHEERLVLPRTCFSIEPGIYLPEFGIRSEVNVYIDAAGQVHVTGPKPQTEIVALP
ncbi:MAG: M24 family metallopeptidase [Gemmataceae bacterium]